jgi:hypothetical protein
MIGLNFRAVIQICNRPSHPKNPVITAGRQIHRLKGSLHELGACLTQSAKLLCLRGTHTRVTMDIQFLKTPVLPLPCCIHPLPDVCGSFGSFFPSQVLIL